MPDTSEAAKALNERGFKFTASDVAELARRDVFIGATKDDSGHWQIPSEAIDQYIRARMAYRRKTRKWLTIGSIATLLTLIFAAISGTKDGLDLLRDLFALPRSRRTTLSPTADAPPETLITSTMTLGAMQLTTYDCIAADYWSPYAAVESDNQVSQLTPVPQPECWYLYDWGIYTREGELLFVGEDTPDNGWYGISAPVSLNGVIEMTLQFDRLSVNDRFDVGIVDGETSDPHLDGVFLQAWMSLDTRWLNLYRIQDGEQKSIAIDYMLQDTYEVRLEIRHAQMDIFLDGEQVNHEPVPVVFSSPRLWIGYHRNTLGGRTSVVVSNLSIRDNQ